MSFEGFDRKALALLSELPSWNAKQYEAARARLKQGVSQPGGALIEEVAAALDVPLSVTRRSSVSPLHRDLRFAAKGSPRYKDHLLLTAWHGPQKQLAATLWIRVDSSGVGFASGLGFDPTRRKRWREAVGGSAGDRLARALRKVETASGRARFEVAGDQLVKVPAPWPDDHPRAELLRMKSFQVRFMEPLPAVVSKPSFVDWCATRLRRLLPVHEWLVEELA